jgi:hypothetical protein
MSKLEGNGVPAGSRSQTSSRARFRYRFVVPKAPAAVGPRLRTPPNSLRWSA